MTDVDYKKLKDSIDKIITNTSLLVEGVNLDDLIKTKKILGTIKGIIGDIAKINECCGKGVGGLDPMMMMMLMNMAKGSDPEVLKEKILGLISSSSEELSKATTDNKEE